MKEKQDLQKMTIDQIESRIDGNIAKARTADQYMIESLIYLKTSGRYKENKRYERATFYDYVQDRFNLTRTKYMEMQAAYIRFPKECKSEGVGFVARVMRRCSSQNAAQAMAHINRAKAGAKKELKFEKIEAIIADHTPKIEKKFTDYKAMYAAEVAAHAKTKEALKAAMTRNAELEEQNEKLKLTAARFKDMREMLQAPFVARKSAAQATA